MSPSNKLKAIKIRSVEDKKGKVSFNFKTNNGFNYIDRNYCISTYINFIMQIVKHSDT